MDKRDQLRNIGERLIEIASDTDVEIEVVKSLINASTCSECSGYGDEVFENIVVVYSR